MLLVIGGLGKLLVFAFVTIVRSVVDTYGNVLDGMDGDTVVVLRQQTHH